MISYAQNGEDVVLARVLAGTVPDGHGFYVDVGASSPDAASVTRHFYELGWRGINIEPRGPAWKDLNDARPRDLNLQVAIGAENGSATFYEVIEDPDLSTIDHDDLEYLAARGYTWSEESVPVRTLDSVLDGAGVTNISFLKVDAEGSEDAVLHGLDLERRRPAVIVIEAVRPWSRERVDRTWRGILEQAGYHEALFDGVNLYFIPTEMLHLKELFAPASALDQYRTAEVVALERELHWYRSKLPTRPAVRTRRTPPPPSPCRFAVVGTPFSGNHWVAEVLAGAANRRIITAAHPADVDWDRLPPAFVLEAPWPRTALAERYLSEAGVKVVSPARDPADVLVAARPDPHGWAEWALGSDAIDLVSRSADWWSNPAVVRVRYEDIYEHPQLTAARLLARWRLAAGQVPPGPTGTLRPSGALDPEMVARIKRSTGAVTRRLGYRPVGAPD